MALHDLFPDDRPAVELNGVVRCFEGANEVVVALDHVDAIIPRGRMTVVAGPSGSGKSTLLALLACTQRADEGTVHVGDTELMALGRNERRAGRRDRLGIVLPQPSENLLDRFDATGNVEWAGKQRRNSTSATVDVIALSDQDFGTLTDFDLLVELIDFFHASISHQGTTLTIETPERTFSKKTSTPASIRPRSFSSDREAGPTVATILVFRMGHG